MSTFFLDSQWVLGVLCSLLASLFSAVGTVLQKHAHMQRLRQSQQSRSAAQRSSLRPGDVESADAKSENEEEVSSGLLLRSPAWLLGLFFLVALPLPFNCAALTLADQSLITPLFGVTLLLNQIVAPALLSETLTCVDLFSTAAILIGSTVSVAMASHSPAAMTFTTLSSLHLAPAFAITQCCVIGFIVLAIVLLRPRTQQPAEPSTVDASGLPPS
eukprot:RCo048536